MKVNVIKLEVEGESHEIRDALPAILASESAAVGGNAQTGPAPVLATPSEPAYVLEAAEGLITPHAESTQPHHEAERAPSDGGGTPEYGPGSANDAARGGSPTSHPATTPNLINKPHDWEAIPPELRVWNATGITCHIAKNEHDLYTTWCGHDVGRVRAMDLEPRTQAQPCGNCVRRLEEAKRKDAE